MDVQRPPTPGPITDAFTYNHLSTPVSLRLLELSPEWSGLPVQVELWETADAEKYRCLSYTWGDQNRKPEIRVNGRTMHVEENLYHLLRRAGQVCSNEPFWVDTLCITRPMTAKRVRKYSA